MRTIFILVLIIISGIGCANSVEKNLSKKQNLATKSIVTNSSKLEQIILPEEFLLEVPFVMQAPFANWDVHNESCEEAGLLLARYYYLGTLLSKETADKEILDMVRFQKENYGAEYDIYAKEMGQLAKDYYGYENYRVIEGTIENMKQEIVNGNPVIVPTTAAYLKGEKGDYPEMGYHVVVVVGYNSRGFVTHDPGTYSGEDFTYSYSTLQNAMKDYNYQVLVLE